MSIHVSVYKYQFIHLFTLCTGFQYILYFADQKNCFESVKKFRARLVYERMGNCQYTKKEQGQDIKVRARPLYKGRARLVYKVREGSYLKEEQGHNIKEEQGQYTK